MPFLITMITASTHCVRLPTTAITPPWRCTSSHHCCSYPSSRRIFIRVQQSYHPPPIFFLGSLASSSFTSCISPGSPLSFPILSQRCQLPLSLLLFWNSTGILHNRTKDNSETSNLQTQTIQIYDPPTA